MSSSARKPVKRIAVIGAGAAGIVQAKQAIVAFSRSEYDLELVVFEARNQVGGVWVEDPTPGPSTIRYTPSGKATALSLQPGVLPSPIYPGLRTNLPHDIMSFRNEPFPPSTEVFPKAKAVMQYLQEYAVKYDLLQYIRFGTTVTRVFKEGGEGWVVESRGPGGEKREEFDFVSVTNGHYEKANLPDIPGLANFKGNIIHSRWYRQPSSYHSQTVIVVGAFASGSDIARELAYENLPRSSLPAAYTSHLPPTPEGSRGGTPEESKRIRVVQSSSGGKNMFSDAAVVEEWKGQVEQKGLIKEIVMREGESVVIFQDGTELTGVDSMIFATGYYYQLPFFKVGDRPWDGKGKVLEEVIEKGDVVEEDGWEVGGMKGLGMKEMDETMVFLKDDRSLAFIGLAYLVVPFPLFEIQSHLTSLLWAGLLPSFPSHPTLPPNPKNVSSTDLANAQPSPPKRYTEAVRGDFVLGYPYEYIYENALLALCVEGDGGVEGGWGEVEGWRYGRREDTGLRRRIVGY